MCPLVFLQGTSVRESLVTLGTGIGLFSGVNSHVTPQVSFLGEGLCTFGAGIRSHASVYLLVLLHATRLREILVTLGTGIRFLSGMNSHVST